MLLKLVLNTLNSSLELIKTVIKVCELVGDFFELVSDFFKRFSGVMYELWKLGKSRCADLSERREFWLEARTVRKKSLETTKTIRFVTIYYNLHPTQASRGLARVKTERMAGRQQVRGVPKTAC